MMHALVTGANGFIGKHLMSTLVADPLFSKVVGVDWNYPTSYDQDDKQTSIMLDCGDCNHMRGVLADYEITHVFHLAAHTSVDESIAEPSKVFKQNVSAMAGVLQALAKEQAKLIHVSTDEVYGPRPFYDPAYEHDRYLPKNPYAASKAACVHMADAYANTYGLEIVTTFACNTYGSGQTFDKLIPRTIKKLYHGERLPIYGDGKQHRVWMHVSDHCNGLIRAAKKGEEGCKYNLSSPNDRVTNLDIVNMIARKMNVDDPVVFGKEDRAGHDTGYAVDCYRAHSMLGWEAQVRLGQGLPSTVDEYLSITDTWKE